MKPTQAQLLRDLQVLRTDVGMTAGRLAREAKYIPYVDVVEAQMLIEGVGEEERGRVAEDFVLCSIETGPRLSDNERQLLRIIVNTHGVGHNITQRKQAIAEHLQVSDRTLERRNDVDVALEKLARVMHWSSFWPCPSGDPDATREGGAVQVSFRAVDHAMTVLSSVEDETAAAKRLISYLEKTYVRALKYFSASTRVADEAVRRMLSALVDSGEYIRLAQPHGDGKPLLSELYTRQMIRALTRHQYWHGRSFFDYLFEAVSEQYSPSNVLLDAARLWAPEWRRDPDIELAIRSTLDTLLAIAADVEANDQWVEIDFAQVQRGADEDGGETGFATDSE